MSTLVVRAAASASVGAGHLMRCIALAERHCARGGEAWFALGPEAGALANAVLGRGMRARTVEATLGTAADADEVVTLARSVGATACVVDGYQFPDHYYARLRRSGLTILAIDDLGRDLPADLTLNPNYGATRGELCGPDHALLRSEFFAHPRSRDREQGTPLRVLITFGGSDPTRAAARVLRLLPADHPVVATAVVGPAYRDDGELDNAAQLAAAHGHIVELARGVPDISGLMANAGAAICAAGTVLWELSYLRVPTLAFAVAGNQSDVSACLARDGYVLSGQWLWDLCDDEIGQLITRLVAHRSVRKRLRRLGQLVDGKGADRVLDALAVPCGVQVEAVA